MTSSLNEKQNEAATNLNGPLLILAGAGAGKTKTIVERVINIIKSGIEPKNILCVTFTNKASKEMLHRIHQRMVEEKLIENDDENFLNHFFIKSNLPMIKTFHSLGLYILKEYGKELGLSKNLTILDPADTNSIIKNILTTLSLDPKLHDASKIKNAISREKSKMETVDDFAKNIHSYNTEIIEKVWRLYDQELEKQKAVDFDDLIVKTIKLLRQNQNLKNILQEKWKYIHIDEYQDTNNSQYEFILELLNPEKNICVVGDVDQNIYSWRGANLKNILHFEKDFKNGKVVLLEENYRSSPQILKLANISINKNKARFEKKLFTSKKKGEEIEICPCYDEKSEATFVAKKILEIRNKNLENPNFSLKNIAILYRANFQSRILEENMLKNNIPYNLLGTKFFERKEIKDILSYLKSSQNRNSLMDLKRVFENPKKGIGKTTIAKIFSGDMESLSASSKEKINKVYEFLDKINLSIQNKEKKLSEILDFIFKESGMKKELEEGGSDDKERIENIQELISIAKEKEIINKNLNTEELLEIFLEEISLKSDQDDDEKNIDGVRLMTIHASKGLEFNIVFLVGLEQDLFPHIDIGNTKKTLEENEEERRLFYVAITRAKEKLFLSFAENRMIYGERKMALPSEFLEELNEMEEDEKIFHDIYFTYNLDEQIFSKKKKEFNFDGIDDEWVEENNINF